MIELCFNRCYYWNGSVIIIVDIIITIIITAVKSIFKVEGRVSRSVSVVKKCIMSKYVS